MKRRTVTKITPSQLASFDQQFWPVLVAITVLSGIGLGAILTIFRGPWLWGSLVVLPIMAIASIVLLFHLDDKKLRRSYQFAIILSLAVHLMVLVFASIVNIFGNGYERPERRVAQRKIRTIEISDQRASFVWEETNSRETPEPEVEPEKQNQPTTTAKPQPIPIEVTETKVTPTPQLTKRKTPQSSVPRQNRELSKLRRQKSNLQPRSSQKMTGETMEITANQPTPSPQPKVEVTDSSAKANAVARSTPTQPQPAEAERATDSAPAKPSQPEVTRTAAARRARQADRIAMSAPKPSPSTARIRRSAPRLPAESRSAPPKESVVKAATRQPTPEPSKSAGQITRRATKANIPQPSKTKAIEASSSQQMQVARAARLRTTRSLQPSISNPASITTDPRRATSEAKVTTSTISIERPSRSPESRTASREVKSKTLSVSRSTDGVVGIGRAKNLDRFAGGEPSPAARASDSARRERTMSTPSEARMLTSSSASELRRARGSVKLPTSAFKADTSAAAKIAGASTPSEKSLESSAAQITSASTSHRDEISAERGSSSVDLGPTKVVNDRERTRRLSGGGQMEVAQLSPDSTRRSRDSSNRQPTLAAAEGLDVAAPRNLSAAPSTADSLEPSSDAVVEARSGGAAKFSADRAAAEVVGEVSDRGETKLAAELSDSRSRARIDRDDAGFLMREDTDATNENRSGDRDRRVTQSPVTFDDPGFGVAKADGMANADPDRTGEEARDSRATELTRQSTAKISGAGLAAASSRTVADSMTNEPSVEAASTRRGTRGSSEAEGATPSLETELVSRRSPRARRNTRPMLDPGPIGELEAAVGTAAGPVAAAPTVESKSVDVAKSASESSEQVQGMELDVMAMEGPAGLGDRPDDFIGVLARPASRDSEQLMPDLKSRFRNREFGGIAAINPDAVIAKESFRNRTPSQLARSADPSTEAAIQLGLEFLARYQSPDGSWTLTGFDREAPQYLTQLDSDTAATGLAVLAFQGAGYNHREYKYAKQLERAIDWLIENQSDDGGLYVATNKKSNDACRLYSHGIAALALTEAYGMTQDPRLEKPAQKALDYIANCQDGRKGGWRYFDTPGKRSSDTSVSGWMMMALQSGRLAGLDVKAATFDGIEDWLDVAADPDNAGMYRYNPYAVDSKGVSRIQGRRASPAMTSVGLLMRIYAGWKKDDPRLLAGAEYLLKTQMPSDSTPQLRDTYYWYYATQVLKHVDGPYWTQWNNKLRPLLTRSQEKTGDMAGSWHPYRPVPDRWGAFGGRLYVTSMNLLSLEVRHRLLPLYQQGEQPQLMGIIETGELIAMDQADEPRQPLPVELDMAQIDPRDADSDFSPGDLLPPIEPPTPPADTSTMTRNEIVADPTRPSEAGGFNVVRNQPEPEIRLDEVAVQRRRSNMLNAQASPSQPTIDGTELAAAMPPKLATLEPGNAWTPTKPSLPKRRNSGSKSVSLEKNLQVAISKQRISRTVRKPPIGDSVAIDLETAPVEALTPIAMNPAPATVSYGTIGGTITLDGEPLDGARIEFIPLGGQGIRMVALSNRLGQYSISEKNTRNKKGIAIGDYRVSVTTTRETPDLDVIDLLEIVPKKYNEDTILNATIEAQTKLDFKLESE